MDWLAENDVWFAWRPVRLVDGRLVWWRLVRRRRSTSFRSGHGGETRTQTDYHQL
jgi:hypothetical protein